MNHIDKNLEYHQKITLTKTLSDELYDRLYDVTEKYFSELKDKNIDFNTQISSYYTAISRYCVMFLGFVELIKVKDVNYLTQDQVNESKEVIDLENKFNKDDKNNPIV